MKIRIKVVRATNLRDLHGELTSRTDHQNVNHAIAQRHLHSQKRMNLTNTRLRESIRCYSSGDRWPAQGMRWSCQFLCVPSQHGLAHRESSRSSSFAPQSSNKSEHGRRVEFTHIFVFNSTFRPLRERSAGERRIGQRTHQHGIIVAVVLLKILHLLRTVVVRRKIRSRATLRRLVPLTSTGHCKSHA